MPHLYRDGGATSERIYLFARYESNSIITKSYKKSYTKNDKNPETIMESGFLLAETERFELPTHSFSVD